MKEYSLYKKPNEGFGFAMTSDYASDMDGETRYVILREWDGRRLGMHKIISVSEFEEDYEFINTVTVHPEEETVARAADNLVKHLVDQSTSGQIIMNVKYAKDGPVISIDGSIDVRNILRRIL